MSAPHQRSSAGLGRVLLRIPVPWVFVLTYLAGVGLEAVLHYGPFLPANQSITGVGLVTFVIGAAIAAWGWLIFYKEGTTRVPGKVSTTVVTRGPYRFTRNPMYVGLSLAYLGEGLIQHQLVPVLLLPLIIVYLNQVVIPVEEERLQTVFGPVYDAYRRQVRRWL